MLNYQRVNHRVNPPILWGIPSRLELRRHHSFFLHLTGIALLGDPKKGRFVVVNEWFMVVSDGELTSMMVKNNGLINCFMNLDDC